MTQINTISAVEFDKWRDNGDPLRITFDGGEVLLHSGCDLAVSAEGIQNVLYRLLQFECKNLLSAISEM